MAKVILTTAFLLLNGLIFGQKNGAKLTDINSISQAENFIIANPKAEAEIFTVDQSTDTSEILLPLFSKKVGFTFNIDNYIYRILSVDSTLSFRASYIFLSGDSFSEKQIDTLRQEIISKYKAGTSFIDLALQYNMDGNVTGDTKWFPENMMVKEFESAVRNHKKGDIFTVDEPGLNWYHVVLKTYDDTFIKKLTVIKFKNSSQQ
jgi:hypothetical protein